VCSANTRKNFVRLATTETNGELKLGSQTVSQPSDA